MNAPPDAALDAVLDAIVRRVAALLQIDRQAPDGLLSAAQVATRLGVERSWVYDHAEELGVVRLGEGPRPRLRFDPAVIAERTLRRRPPDGSRTPVVPRTAGVDLLPIKPPTGTRRRRIVD
jgi:hypothetical protein